MRIWSGVLSAAIGLLFTAGGASAVPVTNGSFVYLTFRDCAASPDCNGGLPIQRGFGTAFGATATQAASNPSLGNSFGEAGPSGVIGAPILRSRAAASSTGRLGASGFSLQRYVNTGPSTLTLAFGGDLTFSFTDPTPGDTTSGGAPIFSGVQVRFSLFETPSGVVDVDLSSNLATVGSVVNADQTPGTVFLYETTPSFLQFTTPTSGSPISLMSTPITVNPGDGFFVYTHLLSVAGPNAVVDASSSFITNFFDATIPNAPVLLSPDSGLRLVIPAPPALILFGAGLLLVAGLRRRSDRARAAVA